MSKGKNCSWGGGGGGNLKVSPSLLFIELLIFNFKFLIVYKPLLFK